MARIVAGVATSHIPAVGAAWDNGKTAEPYWQPLFEGYERSKEWIAKAQARRRASWSTTTTCRPSRSRSCRPSAIGCAAEFPIADEGWGPRPVPKVKGHPELATHIVQSVVLDEFDITIVNKMDVDHGMTVPLSLMFGQPDEWPCPIVPLCVNVVVYPVPTGHRCYMLGKAIRKAVESFDQDLRVVIFGTGGMSHQLQGPRAGLINRGFDTNFLDNLTRDPGALVRIPHLEYLREAGSEGIEMVMWLIMRGALDDDVKEVYRFYHVPASNTALGHIILENQRQEDLRGHR